jgi:hypothetical protein
MVLEPLTEITGTGGIDDGNAPPLAVALAHPSTEICLTVYVATFDTMIDGVVAPLLHNTDAV